MSVKHTTSYIKQYLKNKNIILLSKYFGYHSSLEIICENNHFTTTTFGNIISGGYCKTCGNKKIREKLAHKIDYISDFVKKCNFILMSDQYINSSSKLDLKCIKCNYIWITNFSNLQKYRSCPKCNNRKLCNIQFNEMLKLLTKP